MSKSPFEGIKVLDFTWIGVGPYSVNHLAYFGATTIKVESAARPDPVRLGTPYKDGIAGMERSYYFAFAQMVKKYDITLNLNSPKGREVGKKLVQWADVIAESFTPGTMEKWGLGYEDVKKIKPDIIMLRSCMHGQTGPLAKQAGTGFTLTALSGLDSVTGWPDRPLSGLYGAFTDLIVPSINGFCLVAALDYRRRTGKGLLLDLSQHEVSMPCIGPVIMDYIVNMRQPKTNGNRLDYACPHGIYRCKGNDRWCAIAVFDDTEWKSFCKILGNPDWTRDPRFATLLNRKQNEDEIDKHIEEWTISRTPEEVTAMLQAAGVGAGMAANTEDMNNDPQLKNYHCFHELDHPDMGKLSFYHPPGFTMSQAEYQMHRPPLLGEHNEYVYTDLLGIPDEEFVKLMEEGVFN
jgi:crotonobetainyl-CoA:carnitine CoA-transferase CaiB-like acyl-CoA transferase